MVPVNRKKDEMNKINYYEIKFNGTVEPWQRYAQSAILVMCLC